MAEDGYGERTPDLSEELSADWPVELFYGTEGAQKFKDWYELESDIRPFVDEIKPHILYIGERFFVFRRDDEVVMLPIHSAGNLVTLYDAPLEESPPPALDVRKFVYELQEEDYTEKYVMVRHNFGTRDVSATAYMSDGSPVWDACGAMDPNTVRASTHALRDGVRIGRVAKVVIVG